MSSSHLSQHPIILHVNHITTPASNLTGTRPSNQLIHPSTICPQGLGCTGSSTRGLLQMLEPNRRGGDNNSNVNALSTPSTLTIKPQMKFGVALSDTLWSTAEMGKIRGPDAMGVWSLGDMSLLG